MKFLPIALSLVGVLSPVDAFSTVGKSYPVVMLLSLVGSTDGIVT